MASSPEQALTKLLERSTGIFKKDAKVLAARLFPHGFNRLRHFEYFKDEELEVMGVKLQHVPKLRKAMRQELDVATDFDDPSDFQNYPGGVMHTRITQKLEQGEYIRNPWFEMSSRRSIVRESDWKKLKSFKQRAFEEAKSGFQTVIATLVRLQESPFTAQTIRALTQSFTMLAAIEDDFHQERSIGNSYKECLRAVKNAEEMYKQTGGDRDCCLPLSAMRMVVNSVRDLLSWHVNYAHPFCSETDFLDQVGAALDERLDEANEQRSLFIQSYAKTIRKHFTNGTFASRGELRRKPKNVITAPSVKMDLFEAYVDAGVLEVARRNWLPDHVHLQLEAAKAGASQLESLELHCEDEASPDARLLVLVEPNHLLCYRDRNGDYEGGIPMPSAWKDKDEHAMLHIRPGTSRFLENTVQEPLIQLAIVTHAEYRNAMPAVRMMLKQAMPKYQWRVKETWDGLWCDVTGQRGDLYQFNFEGDAPVRIDFVPDPHDVEDGEDQGDDNGTLSQSSFGGTICFQYDEDEVLWCKWTSDSEDASWGSWHGFLTNDGFLEWRDENREFKCRWAREKRVNAEPPCITSGVHKVFVFTQDYVAEEIHNTYSRKEFDRVWSSLAEAKAGIFTEINSIALDLQCDYNSNSRITLSVPPWHYQANGKTSMDEAVLRSLGAHLQRLAVAWHGNAVQDVATGVEQLMDKLGKVAAQGIDAFYEDNFEPVRSWQEAFVTALTTP